MGSVGFAAKFDLARAQLVPASNESLLLTAGQGGWRKLMVDRLRLPVRSWIDIPRMLGFMGGSIVVALPPFGDSYRRALVAQSILDGKAAHW